ncbi:hypothetical protein DFJ74DRAFT_653512 [Hyaloraphidium curvatum]|nr:hypothetical protein DFJ74DRAFT_653512 [Hyaloraphidium curvatum]
MGGGGRFPYPKWVWSPAGGWWGQPKNWRSNFAVVLVGISAIAYQIHKVSAEREVRLQPPIGWIPSMLWAAEFKNKPYQEEIKKHYDEGIYLGKRYSFQKAEAHGHHEESHH